MNCLLCHQKLYEKVVLKDMFSFQKEQLNGLCRLCRKTHDEKTLFESYVEKFDYIKAKCLSVYFLEKIPKKFLKYTFVTISNHYPKFQYIDEIGEVLYHSNLRYIPIQPTVISRMKSVSDHHLLKQRSIVWISCKKLDVTIEEIIIEKYQLKHAKFLNLQNILL